MSKLRNNESERESIAAAVTVRFNESVFFCLLNLAVSLDTVTGIPEEVSVTKTANTEKTI